MKVLPAMLVACGFSMVTLAHAAPDAEKAQALMKKSGCMTCHSVDKDKVGPAFKKVAKDLKGKPDAEAVVTKQITAKPMITVDGAKVEHKSIASSDPAEIKNVVAWILSQ